MASGRRKIPSKDDPKYVRPPDDAYELADDPNYRQHQAINNVLTRRLINRVTGRGDDEQTVYGVTPDRQYFAGVLSSQYKYREAQAEGDIFENIAEDVAPFRIGVKFRLPADIPDGAQVKLLPTAKTYYRRFPDIEEQRERGNRTGDENDPTHHRGATQPGEQPEPAADGGELVTIETDEVGYEEDETTQSLLRVFERVNIDFDVENIPAEEIRRLADEDDVRYVDMGSALNRAKQAYYDDGRRFRERTEGVTKRDAREVPESALESEEEFRSWRDAHYDGPDFSPLWASRLEVTVREAGDHFAVTASLVNTHGEEYPDAEDYEYRSWRAFLFDAGIEVRLEDTAVEPFQLTDIENEYQYEGRMYAVGDNCAAAPVYPDDEKQDPFIDIPPIGVKTVAVPVYQQAKYLPRRPVPAPFSVLSERETVPSNRIDDELDVNDDLDLDSCLKLIEQEMRAAEEDYRAIQDQVIKGKSEKASREFDRALESFEEERERFCEGRRLIREDPQVREAFISLNKTFDNMADFDEWRLFQIVFIVMTIPDIVSQAKTDSDVENRLDVADVIYYPTGGGKTEAYLGLVAFTAFHDRLRGKYFGTTALTKFPLRFLSLQQLQRAAEVLGQAELIRREHAEMRDSDPFSVGYLVGSQNTPNKLMNKTQYGRENRIREATEDDNDEFLVVSECPFCGKEEVEIDGDMEQARILHRCTNPDCPWVKAHEGGAADLPIYITDREIYRYAPTFVVSTIDKIAIMGMQRRFRTLVGNIKHRCPHHGFTGESYCLVDDQWDYPANYRCDSSDLEEVGRVDPPSLIIQDELHLLREEFGAFDSHYETFLQALVNRATDGDWQMKIVAATATIQGADHQVRGLYRCEQNTFPSPGPRLKQSFYAYAHPRRTGRNMIGALPRSVTRTYAINKIHEVYAQLVQDAQSNPEGLVYSINNGESNYSYEELEFPDDGDERHDRLLELLDDYEVQISYHYAKDNTELMKRSVRTMINPNLTSSPEGYEDLRAVLMTGETPLDEVRSFNQTLEAPPEERVDSIDMVIATSMISHGVDIDRFNFIAFHGMPRQTAEYIQSYSRVGRSVPGSVFVLYHPMRVRDQSYYQQFRHYHEYEDLLVEATPLERWAEFAIEQTISGIVCGALLQHYDYELDDEIDGRMYDWEGLQEALHKEKVDQNEVLQFVRDAYDVGDAGEAGSSDGAALYSQRVDSLFNTVWRYILKQDPDDDTFIPNILEGGQDDHEEPGVRRPMMSLRDIDEQIPIEMESNTAQVINLFSERQ